MLFIVINTDEEVLFIEKLYAKYSKFMYKVAYDILHNQWDCEDAIQETLIRLIDNISKIGNIDDKKTRNFIGVICRNVSIDIYNKEKKTQDVEDDDIEDTNDLDVSLVVISKDNVDAIKKYICTLDIKYQDVLLLRIQNYSVKEIAAVLRLNSKTVQKRIERARKMLLEFLNERDKNGK